MLESVNNFDLNRCKCINKLMMNDSFKEFLKFIEDSREMTHQAMYNTNDDRLMARLQGQAETLFGIVNACYMAREQEKALAKLKNQQANPIEKVGG